MFCDQPFSGSAHQIMLGLCKMFQVSSHFVKVKVLLNKRFISTISAKSLGTVKQPVEGHPVAVVDTFLSCLHGWYRLRITDLVVLSFFYLYLNNYQIYLFQMYFVRRTNDFVTIYTTFGISIFENCLNIRGKLKDNTVNMISIFLLILHEFIKYFL